METTIEFRNLTYRYPDTTKPALSNINLKVRQGEFVLVRGSSGSGKSTLLRCIMGLVPHYTGGFFKGRVTVNGLDTLKHSVEEISTLAGMVFQDPENQLVCTTVVNELAFGMENLRLERMEMHSRMLETARELGIEHLLDRKTTEISAGEKQKIILASVLAMQPKVLLLDEPSSQLDPSNTRKLNSILLKLNREKDMTIVLVEHDFTAFRKVDRILDLDKNRKKESTPEKNRPRSIEGKSIIEISNLKYSYGSRAVLNNINMRINEGEFTVVTGPNGSGKTTLLKHINGLLKPAEGNVVVDGVNTRKTSVEQLARTVGFLSQNPNDYLFCDTVADELYFTLKNLRIKGDVEKTLADFNLDKYRDHYPRDLSGGERQRVALASILVAKPRIVVLDEPTRGIDTSSRRKLLKLLYGMSSEGKTIVVATHDMDLASHGDHLIKLKEGNIVLDRKND